MIQELKELIHIVTKQKVSQIEILTESSQLDTKSRRLLEGLRNETITSDEEAMQLLYPEGKRQTYQKLKNRLYNRLLNTLFFIDVKKYNKGEAGKIKDSLYKEYSQIMLIRGQGHRELAINMATKLLEKSMRYEAFDISLLLSNILEEFYSVWQPNKRLLSYYANVYDETAKKIRELRSITFIWTGLVESLMARRTNVLNEESSSYYIEELTKLNRIEGSSFLFNYRLYSSWIVFYWLKQDYHKQLEICKRALKSIRTSNQKDSIHGLSFINYKGIAELNLRDYKSAENTLNSILYEYPLTPGKVHWLNIQNYLFLVKILRRKYYDAFEILYKVVNLRNFKKTDKKWREPWLIKEAYINLLIKIGKIDLEKLQGKKIRKFRLSKFVNDVPLFFKDKRGQNVSILIAQFIFLLIENKTNAMHDRLDGLKQYSYRYLRNDSTFRSNCFIKMLLKIPGAGFHPVRVENHTKDLKKKLLSTPMMISEQSYEVEIIPYEDLWEIVMEILHKRNKSKVRISL